MNLKELLIQHYKNERKEVKQNTIKKRETIITHKPANKIPVPEFTDKYIYPAKIYMKEDLVKFRVKYVDFEDATLVLDSIDDLEVSLNCVIKAYVLQGKKLPKPSTEIEDCTIVESSINKGAYDGR